MNVHGFLFLLIPLMGLAPIFRDGRFRWRVVPSSQLLTAVFWFGWFSSLIFAALGFAGVLK